MFATYRYDLKKNRANLFLSNNELIFLWCMVLLRNFSTIHESPFCMQIIYYIFYYILDSRGETENIFKGLQHFVQMPWMKIVLLDEGSKEPYST